MHSLFTSLPFFLSKTFSFYTIPRSLYRLSFLFYWLSRQYHFLYLQYLILYLVTIVIFDSLYNYPSSLLSLLLSILPPPQPIFLKYLFLIFLLPHDSLVYVTVGVIIIMAWFLYFLFYYCWQCILFFTFFWYFWFYLVCFLLFFVCFYN